MKNGYDRYLDFQYDRSGDFFRALFRAITLADIDNTAQLAKGFPEEVNAYRVWTRLGVARFLTLLSPGHDLREQFMAEYQLKDD